MTTQRTAVARSGICVVLSAALLAGLFWGGCKKSQSKSHVGKSKKTALDSQQTVLKGWPKPALAIVLSGQQHGYMEPCGCTAENQLGGLAHRADLFRILRERGWPVTALDLGSTIDRTRLQDQYKLQTFLRAFEILRYGAVALGRNELELARDSGDFMLTLSNLSPDETDAQPPFVSANVNIAGVGPRGFQIVKVGGKTIGVTAIITTRYQRKILPVGANVSLKMRDPETELPKAIAALQKQKPDLMVLLAFGDMDESKKIAKQFPVFDLIQTIDMAEDGNRQPETVGKTLLVAVGRKGKHVGVVGFYPDSAKQRLRFKLVELDARRFKGNKAMHDLMKEYQAKLKDNHADVFASDVKFGSHPSGSTFVGAAKCGECHKKAYKKWKSTPHAHGYESLITGRPDQHGTNYITRQYDPECLVCHVTGWNPKTVSRYDSGFTLKELAERGGMPQLFNNLKGQQCENCHGPGSEHVTLETAWRIKPKPALRERVMKLRETMADEHLSCTDCHDLDNSPKFDYDKYWEKIEHIGKD